MNKKTGKSLDFFGVWDFFQESGVDGDDPRRQGKSKRLYIALADAVLKPGGCHSGG
jgi:hypothetical protein